MNFGYDGVDNSKIIRGYSKSGDTIAIEYLDGSLFEIPLSEENEGHVLDLMLTQARTRDRVFSVSKNECDRKKDILYAVWLTSLGLLNTSLAFTNGTTFSKVAAGICYSGAVFESICYAFENSDAKEIEKYNIYLGMKNELDKYNDSDLYQGINNNQLNINTIDDYSLKDLKKIRNNLERSKELNENKTLVKKR